MTKKRMTAAFVRNLCAYFDWDLDSEQAVCITKAIDASVDEAAAEYFAEWAIDMNPNFKRVELAKAWRKLVPTEGE